VERQVTKGFPEESFQLLLEEAWQRKARPVRLIGLGVRFVDISKPSLARQLVLFE
jgi:DNA polymerase-4